MKLGELKALAEQPSAVGVLPVPKAVVLRLCELLDDARCELDRAWYAIPRQFEDLRNSLMRMTARIEGDLDR